MENEKGYEDEREAVHSWIKQCREKLDIKDTEKKGKTR
jgi:hypothetical protein